MFNFQLGKGGGGNEGWEREGREVSRESGIV